MKKKVIQGGCLALAGILFLLFLFSFQGKEKTKLLETEGRDFVKAEVIQVIEDNETENGNYVGSQRVELLILSGTHEGEKLEAESSSGYLYGAHCEVGMKVTAIVSEAEGTVTASVYSIHREPRIWLMVAIFVLVVCVVGGKKGLASIGGLLFTLVCIVFLFLPMIYRGISPILAAIVVVAVTTVVTMIFIDGFSRKSVAAILGTVSGVIVAGGFAWLFGQVADINGYNVSDVENLVYIEGMTDIQVGQLLFAGILIAASGAVMDVGMSIASTLNELKEKNPVMTAGELFRSGMNVGRDMMGTMSNTLILAFTGGSINTLVFIYAYNYPYRQIINMYSVGIELMQGLSSSMGVILTVPFTSLIAAIFLAEKSKVKSP